MVTREEVKFSTLSRTPVTVVLEMDDRQVTYDQSWIGHATVYLDKGYPGYVGKTKSPTAREDLVRLAAAKALQMEQTTQTPGLDISDWK